MSSYTNLDAWKYNMEFFPKDAHTFEEKNPDIAKKNVALLHDR